MPSSEVVAVIVAVLAATTGVVAGIVIPERRMRFDKSDTRRTERLNAYVAYLGTISTAEAALKLMPITVDDETVIDLDNSDQVFDALAAAHAANMPLYLLAPYSLAHSAEQVIREMEVRWIAQMHGELPSPDHQWWDAVVDEMRDDLGTPSILPTAEKMRNRPTEPDLPRGTGQRL